MLIVKYLIFIINFANLLKIIFETERKKIISNFRLPNILHLKIPIINYRFKKWLKVFIEIYKCNKLNKFTEMRKKMKRKNEKLHIHLMITIYYLLIFSNNDLEWHSLFLNKLVPLTF